MRYTRIVTLIIAAGTGLLVSGGLAATGLAATRPPTVASAVTAGAVAAVPPPHGTMTTIAGGTGGPAAATSVSVSPCAIKYSGGSLYISTGGSDIQAVYKVSQRTGELTRVAGSGLSGLDVIQQPADRIPASEYAFASPCGTAVDAAGNVLVADSDQTLVVTAKYGTFYGRSMAAGHVYTVSAWSGEDGTQEVQLDAAGNLVMTEGGSPASHTNDETYAQVIVKAERTGTFYGQRMVRNKVYTIAGLPRGGAEVPPGGYRPVRSATARAATARAAMARAAAARAAMASGVRARQDDLGYEIGAVRFDAAGNIVLADPGGNGFGAIGAGSDVSPSVQVIPLRSGTFYHRVMKAGYAYTIAGGGNKTPNGVPGPSAALGYAAGVALDRNGNVLVADAALHVIAARTGRFYGRAMTAGDIYALSKLPAQTAAVDNAGNVLFGGSAASRVYLLAAKTGSFYGQRVRAGQVYPIAGNGQPNYSGDGGPAAQAELIDPYAIAANQTGTLTAVTDIQQAAVRVVVRDAGRHFARALRAGDIYTVAGSGTGNSAASGVPGASVTLGYPDGAAFDRQGNLVISDSGDHRVHVVANASGTYYGRKMTSGDIYTVAGTGTEGFSGDGGPALAASVDGPEGVAVDKNGNVLLIDSGNGPERVRVVATSTGTFYGQPMTAGDIYTMAGTGAPGYAGDGGLATAAEIEPLGITGDTGGNLVIADNQNVRVVAGRTGTFYGRAMTAGYIYTVAGGGTLTSDGTPALRAQLTAIVVAVDQAGNLLVGEGDNVDMSTVWMVAEKAGTYYGKAMHAGDVYTVAHSAGGDLFLDGVPASRALFTATGIAVQPGTENLLITDFYAHRLRSVSR